MGVLSFALFGLGLFSEVISLRGSEKQPLDRRDEAILRPI